MKPTSEQTRNGVLSAVSFRQDDMLKMKSFFRYSFTQIGPPVSVEVVPEASVDTTNAYGCVDWFIYPDSQVREQK